jgi:hypothetical protein
MPIPKGGGGAQGRTERGKGGGGGKLMTHDICMPAMNVYIYKLQPETIDMNGYNTIL